MKKNIKIAGLLLLLAVLLTLPIQAATGTTAAGGTAATPGELAYATISLKDCESASSVMVTYEAPAGLTAVQESSAWLLKGGIIENIDAAQSRAVYTYDAAADLNGDILKLAFRMPKTSDTEEFTVKYKVTIREGSQDPVVLEGKATLKLLLRPATSVKLDKQTLTLDLKDGDVSTLAAAVLPADTTDEIVWSSSDETVATVDQTGKITVLKSGTVTITVKAGKLSASCKITVSCSHELEWKQTAAPEKLKEGKEIEVCKICGHETGEARELLHLHDAVKHEASNATCVAAGNVEYWTCEGKGCKDKHFTDESCTAVHTKDTAIAKDPDNHAGQQTELRDAADANCAKPGYTGDTWCLGCEKLIQKGKEIPAEEHSFKWIVDKKPTEEKAGSKHQACSKCGYENGVVESIAKLKHKPELVAGTPATCEEAGTAEHFFCKNCGKYYASADGAAGEEIAKESIVLPATGHTYGEVWVSDAAYHWHSCTCGHEADKAAHNGTVAGKVDATEDKPGYTGDTVCADCGYKLAAGEEIPALGTVPPSAQPTVPSETVPPVDDGEDQADSTAAIVLLVVAAVAAAGATVAALLKKRSGRA